MNKEIKIGKYTITFGIKKELPKRAVINIPTMAAEVLRKEDVYLNGTKHVTYRKKIGDTILRRSDIITPIRLKIVKEMEITEEDVLKKMMEITEKPIENQEKQ